MSQRANDFGRVLYELSIPGKEIKAAEETFKAEKALKTVLSSPIVSANSKNRIISAVFSGKLVPFLKVATRCGAIGEIDDIFEANREYYNKQNNILAVTISYTIHPSDKQLSQMKKYLCKKFDVKKVKVDLVEDPSLISGFLMKAGNVEIDFSLKGRLNKMQRELVRR